MTTSFTHLDDNGFWCPDALLEVFAHYLAADIQECVHSAWARRYVEHLNMQAGAGLSGCIDIGLSGLEPANRREVAASAGGVVQRLVAEPQLLAAPALNSLGLGDGSPFERDVQAESIQALGRVLADLIEGTWDWGANADEALPRHWLPRE